MHLFIGGIAAIILGYLIGALTRLDELGHVVIVIGVIAALVGVALMLVNRSRTGPRH